MDYSVERRKQRVLVISRRDQKDIPEEHTHTCPLEHGPLSYPRWLGNNIERRKGLFWS